jgi:hypothetical protein
MFAQNSSDGAVVAAGGIVVNTGYWVVMNAKSLVLGTDGISFNQSAPFHFTNSGTVYSLGATTVLGTEEIGSYCASNDKPLTICTTQFESDQPATITFSGNLKGKKNYWADATVTGCGKVVFASTSTSNRGLTVNDGATLAVSTGAVFSVTTSDTTSTVNSGGTIEVSESGVFTVSSNFTLADGACLGFNFTDKAVAPSLAVASGKTVTIGSTVNVKISASDDIRPKGGTYTLTGGMDFTGKTVNIVDRPDWVQSVEIDASGNLVAMVKHNGLIISFH